MKKRIPGEERVNGSAATMEGGTAAVAGAPPARSRGREARSDPPAGIPPLVARAQEGDRHAFEELYREHVGRVFAVCLRLVADRERAEALTQDAFVRAWEKLNTFQGRGAFRAWLTQLTANVVIEDARRRSRQANWLETVSEAEMRALHGTDNGAAPVGQRLSRTATPPRDAESAIDLERAIAALPPGARTVFVLHDVNGYKYREVATLVGVAEGTVKAQLHRARRLLRAALGKQPGGRS